MRDSTETGEPGNYGVGFPNFLGKVDDPEARKSKLAAELANGRLAMMAIIGMFFQDGLTGSAWGDWATYTASPLRAFENELGVQAPFGFWDPLGYTADGNKDDFTRRRVTEIKHGRVAMLACMGYITPEYARWPALCSPSEKLAFADIDNGLKAVSLVPLAGWVQIVAFIGSVELFQFKYDPSRAPGDYEAAGVLGVPRTVQGTASTLADPEAKKRKLNAELANGRLAMMAIIGMFFQDGLTGSAWGNWELYTDSPLRAFEGELGVQPPVGYWDPAGLSADGDAEAFKRRRGIELKHGRVAMIACMGYIVPEYFRWPGFCSPTQGVAFEDVPNGLAALSKIPGAGWIQIVLFCGNLEIGFFKYDPTRAPGDFANGGVLGVPNGTTLPAGELKNKKLSSELANGRLAMMAIIGMFFQDGLTGSAWGSWDLYTDSPLRAFESETGVQAPLGYWDPLGLSKDGDMETFKRRRSTELKHGRVAMFATLGYIVPESVKLPGYLSPTLKLPFAEIPNGLSAVTKVPGAGWFQVVLFLGYCELAFLKEGDEPGNYGLGYLGALNGNGRGQSFIKAPEVRKKKLNAELANGRLAMMAIIGMFYQDGLTGSAWGDWSNYADSPLRAFENEPGCQFPLGESGKYIWDPAGLATDPETFKKYRSAEIKHGRVAMLATFGLVFQHYYHFKALSFPDSYLDLSGSPNGVEAISQYPSNVGFACLVLSAGIAEMYFNDEKGEFPGDFGDPWGLKQTLNLDKEGLEKFRRYELEHGRLAMFGTIGTIAAEKVSGLDGVDQWNTDATRQAFAKFLTATTYGLANDGF
eukprot:TRINITY_DN953_c0_g1_i1.p1 TRINITY_DN953_c0_g1~~TRINITY_DN953_c0_g1_i1.p1  ORF type:complete len:950 (+),score=191.02 TRINITY_DN953_c0_g1_i1:420-2852(+)